MLVAMVVLDLAIPRLVERIIDEGIRQGGHGHGPGNLGGHAWHLGTVHDRGGAQQQLVHPGRRERGARPQGGPFRQDSGLLLRQPGSFFDREADGSPDERLGGRAEAVSGLPPHRHPGAPLDDRQYRPHVRHEPRVGRHHDPPLGDHRGRDRLLQREDGAAFQGRPAAARSFEYRPPGEHLGSPPREVLRSRRSGVRAFRRRQRRSHRGGPSASCSSCRP